MLQWIIPTGVALISSAALTAYWLLKTPEVTEQERKIPEEPFSLERYEPMRRLLSAEDLEFLRRRTRIGEDAIRKLQQDRYRIFRAYLRELSADFGRLHAQARQIAASVPESEAHVVDHLIQVQIRFKVSVALVQMRLRLHEASGHGTIDVQSVLGPVAALHQSLESAA